MQAGRYRYQHARAGQQIETPDATIAAVARAHKATVVTANTKDFPMTDIPVVAPSLKGGEGV